MYKSAIAGCGAIAPLHIKALEDLNIQITAVSDPDSSKTQKYQNAAHYTDYESMINAGGFDVLHICLPHYLHAPAAIYAMKRGIHVLCEKPMATTMEDAEEMIKVAEAYNVKLGIIFQNRYNPGSQLIKSVLNSGVLGKPLNGWLKVTWHRNEKYYTESGWRGKWETEGGGVLINQSIHTFDLMNYFMGGKPNYIEASIANRAHPSIEVEDVAEGVIAYGQEGDEVKVSFYATTMFPYDAPVMLEIICEKGKITMTGDSAVIEHANGKIEKSAPEDDKSLPPGTKSYWGVSHSKQIKAFYESLAKNEKPEIDGKAAIITQKLINGIYESGRSGKRFEF